MYFTGCLKTHLKGYLWNLSIFKVNFLGGQFQCKFTRKRMGGSKFKNELAPSDVYLNTLNIRSCTEEFNWLEAFIYI